MKYLTIAIALLCCACTGGVDDQSTAGGISDDVTTADTAMLMTIAGTWTLDDFLSTFDSGGELGPSDPFTGTLVIVDSTSTSGAFISTTATPEEFAVQATFSSFSSTYDAETCIATIEAEWMPIGSPAWPAVPYYDRGRPLSMEYHFITGELIVIVDYGTFTERQVWVPASSV